MFREREFGKNYWMPSSPLITNTYMCDCRGWEGRGEKKKNTPFISLYVLD
jgi:hypothetical protein